MNNDSTKNNGVASGLENQRKPSDDLQPRLVPSLISSGRPNVATATSSASASASASASLNNSAENNPKQNGALAQFQTTGMQPQGLSQANKTNTTNTNTNTNINKTQQQTQQTQISGQIRNATVPFLSGNKRPAPVAVNQEQEQAQPNQIAIAQSQVQPQHIAQPASKAYIQNAAAPAPAPVPYNPPMGSALASTSHEQRQEGDMVQPHIPKQTNSAIMSENAKPNGRGISLVPLNREGKNLSEKKIRRLEKNRLSARNCRRKKKEYTQNLQREMNILEGENLRLRLQLQVR